MTEKEEKTILLASLFMLIAATVTVAVGLYLKAPVSGKEMEQVSENDSGEPIVQEAEEPYQELYYLAGQGFFAGTVTEANERHADCFVILECEERDLQKEGTDADETAGEETEKQTVFVYYNDEFVIPEYDSRAFALDIREFMTAQKHDTNVNLAFSEEEVLQDAMVPSVKIRTDISPSDMKQLLSDCMIHIFTETEKEP